MYGETSVGILIVHTRNKQVRLHVDTTGSVVSKIPELKKNVLYYALILAGHGSGAPPCLCRDVYLQPHCALKILLAFAVSQPIFSMN